MDFYYRALGATNVLAVHEYASCLWLGDLELVHGEIEIRTRCKYAPKGSLERAAEQLRQIWARR